MTADYVMVYITASNKEEASMIARELVSNRLAACANIYAEMSSVYWWSEEGSEPKLNQDHESVIICKTTNKLFPSLEEKVKSIHSYSVPCVVSVPILDGNPDFLAWISKETA